MNAVILGSSRVGALIAQHLDKQGHTVSVVDWNSESFRRLGKDFRGRTVLGNGIDEAILRKAGIEKADSFLAVTNSDNTNLMSAQLVQVRFKTDKVVVRVYDPQRAQAFRELGLTVICPTTSIVDELEKELKKKKKAVENPEPAEGR